MAIDGMITNSALAVDIARVETRLEALEQGIDRLQETLDGFLNGTNGRPGVIERLVISEQAIAGLSARIVSLESLARDPESADKGKSKMHWKVVLAIIGVTGTLATGLVAIATKLAGS